MFLEKHWVGLVECIEQIPDDTVVFPVFQSHNIKFISILPEVFCFFEIA